MNAGRLPDLPIFVDSPMAVRATEVFRPHPECFDDETLRLLREHPDLFGERHVRYVEKVHESIALNDRPRAVRHHLGQRHVRGGPRPAPPEAQHRGPAQHDPDRRLPGRRTRWAGGWWSGGRRCASWGGRSPSKAEVVVLNGLSSHADHGELLRQLGPMATTTRAFALFMAIRRVSTALAEALQAVRLRRCRDSRAR